MMQDKLLGGWRPERWEWTSTSTGALLYATSNLEGILIYAPDGTMAVHVRSTRGPALPAPNARRGETLLQWGKRLMVATPGFQWGYVGRYEVDETQGEVLHHVEVRSRWISREPVLRRHVTWAGDRLCLEYTDRGSHDRLFWRRAQSDPSEKPAVNPQIAGIAS